MGQFPMNGRLLPAFFFITCLTPTIFGVYRIFLILTEGTWIMEFAAAHVDQIPLLLHCIGGIGFLVLGAHQLLPGTRQRNLSRHRRMGRLTASLGILAGVSGVWMTVMHPDISGPLLAYGRIAAGSAWTIFILLAIRAVISRNLPGHRAWMIRAYAIALPAGTLPFLFVPLIFIFDASNQLFEETVQVGAWVLHLAVAEWIIRRPNTAKGKPVAGAAKPLLGGKARAV